MEKTKREKNEQNRLVEIHIKFPADRGHKKVRSLMTITRQILVEKIEDYLNHRMTLEK